MTNEELVRAALEKVGGKSNVLTATNCMTRLRVRVKDDAKIDDEGLKAIEGVMGIVHDRTGYVEIVVGPGKCRKCADICRDMGIPADAAASTANDWQTNKAAVKAGQKQSKVKELFKTFGDIYPPSRALWLPVCAPASLPDQSRWCRVRRHPCSFSPAAGIRTPSLDCLTA